VYIGPAAEWFYRVVGGTPKQWVGLNFNNSQFGALKIGDGSFKYLGQD
jgi:hypothetical protein